MNDFDARGFTLELIEKSGLTGKLNNKQISALIHIISYVYEFDFLTHGGFQEGYEWKEISLKLSPREYARTPWGLVFLLTEVGSKGDEGTLAAVLARTRRHFMIGPGGAIEIADLKGKGKSSWRRWR